MTEQQAILAEPIQTVEDANLFLKDANRIGKNGNRRFKINNKMVHLTYPGRIDPNIYIPWIKTLVGSTKKPVTLEAYSIVTETGTKTVGYEHTHAALRFSDSIVITDSRFFDYNQEPTRAVNPHPNITVISVEHHWSHVVNVYHRKTAIPYTNITPTTPILITHPNPIIQAGDVKVTHSKRYIPKDPVTLAQLEKCKTERDVVVLLDATSPAQLAKAPQYFRTLTMATVKSEKQVTPHLQTLRAWQSELHHQINSCKERDNRIIIWYIDEKGGSGKTVFSTDLVNHHGACMLTTTNIKDASHILIKFIKENKRSPETVIINLVRTAGEYNGIYPIIEAFKDGTFSSGKYDSTAVTLDINPVILVMSNSHPDIDKLSCDRWWIRVIDREGQEVTHNFVGDAAKALYHATVDSEKTKQLIGITKNLPYTPLYPSGEVIDIGHFKSSIDIVRNLDLLYSQYKIGTMSFSYRPPTQSDRLSGIPEYNYRPLTKSEELSGKISLVKLDIRDMTPQEVIDADIAMIRKQQLHREQLTIWATNSRKKHIEEFERECDEINRLKAENLVNQRPKIVGM